MHTKKWSEKRSRNLREVIYVQKQEHCPAVMKYCHNTVKKYIATTFPTIFFPNQSEDIYAAANLMK